MTQREKTLLRQIAKKAVWVDWEKAFGGKSAGNHHLFRVNKILKYLLRHEPGQKFITLAAGWVHDVTLGWQSDEKETTVAKITANFLRQFPKLSASEHQAIIAAVAGHESGHLGSQEAKLVHDADVVDKSGMLGVIRHIWKMTNLLEKRLLRGDQDLRTLADHLHRRQRHLATPTGRQLAAYLEKGQKAFFADHKFAREQLEEISRLAMAGIIADKIAKKLIARFHHPSIQQLEEQLSCRYLKQALRITP